MHSDMTLAAAGAGFGALLPFGVGFILAVITPLLAVRTYRRKRDEWRHIRWITALYLIGSEGMAAVLIYGGARNIVDIENSVPGAFSIVPLIVGLMSVIATAVWAVLVASNFNSRRGGTLDG